jgi:hypothetical protein
LELGKASFTWEMGEQGPEASLSGFKSYSCCLLWDVGQVFSLAFSNHFYKLGIIKVALHWIVIRTK